MLRMMKMMTAQQKSFRQNIMPGIIPHAPSEGVPAVL
jgi:hypothetical protein